MSIKRRVEDSVILSGMGRKDAALLAACVAVAATSRLRYRRPTKKMQKEERKSALLDEAAFCRFLDDECESVFGQGLRLRLTSRAVDPADPDGVPVHLELSQIIYKFVRSELIHAARIAPTIEFVTFEPGVLHAAYLPNERKFVFSDNWPNRLLRAVVFARENDGEFEEERRTNTIRTSLSLPIIISANDVRDFSRRIDAGESAIESGTVADFVYSLAH